MKSFLPAIRSLPILLYSLIQILVPITALAQPKGVVDCALEWHSDNKTYTYVFSGVVSSEGRPCPNAKIHLQLSFSRQPDLVQETIALADGTYELKVSVTGKPEDSTDWKLIAQAPETSTQSAEIEGRTILTDENSVAVERPIQLVQG